MLGRLCNSIGRAGALFLIGGVAIVSGCTSGGQLDASSEIFSGLDPAVVSEVLTSPVAMKKISEESPDSPELTETRNFLAQGIVRNFIVCRDFLSAFQDWQRTGTVPESPLLPRPENPVQASDDLWKQEHQKYVDVLQSGDITQLRDLLTNDTGCGVWIPAKPGDVSGPTIAEVINGGA